MTQPIDIILPCYNPQKGWQNELLNFYEAAKDTYNITYILVNDGSTNGELSDAVPLLQKKIPKFKLITYPENRGKGYALRQGVAASENHFVVYTDVDFPFTNQSMFKVIDEICKNQHDVLAGSRDASYYKNKMSFFRKTLSKSFRFFLEHLLKLKVTDTQCGLKAFNVNGKKEFLNTKINRYLFDFEFIFYCSKNNNLKVSAIPVDLKPNVLFSKMRMKVLLQETLNLFKVILFR